MSMQIKKKVKHLNVGSLKDAQCLPQWEQIAGIINSGFPFTWMLHARPPSNDRVCSSNNKTIVKGKHTTLQNCSLMLWWSCVSYKCIQHLNCCSNSNLMLKVKCLGTGLGYAYHYAFSHFTHYVVVRFWWIVYSNLAPRWNYPLLGLISEA